MSYSDDSFQAFVYKPLNPDDILALELIFDASVDEDITAIERWTSIIRTTKNKLKRRVLSDVLQLPVCLFRGTFTLKLKHIKESLEYILTKDRILIEKEVKNALHLRSKKRQLPLSQ